jgi:glucose-6-phosphate isomerase
MLNTLHFNCKYNAHIVTELAKEKSEVGYYDLPYQDTNYVDEYLAKLNLENIKSVVIIGIGGSSLGIRAVYHFIKASRELPRKMYFMGSTDPLSIKNTLDKIKLEHAHFIVISKSGTTVETIATYKYLLSFVDKSQFSFITDKNSKLDKYARENGQIVVNIQPKIGGRFSVLSAVGIIPLAFIGVNYQELLLGAREISDEFWQAKNTNILVKAYFYAKNQHTYNINTIFSYSDSLHYFNGWFEQLWGESLGKKQLNSQLNVGPTPISLIGPKDQHSFLQLLAQGTRNKTLTVITLCDVSSKIKVPNISLNYLEELDIFNNLTFADLINRQAQSTILALRQIERLPIDEIILQTQDEKTIGKLLFYYQLLTSLVGKLLDVNTYNQPGVELGKTILKQNLEQKKC